MKKRVITIVAAILCIALLAACSAPQAQPSAAAGESVSAAPAEDAQQSASAAGEGKVTVSYLKPDGKMISDLQEETQGVAVRSGSLLEEMLTGEVAAKVQGQGIKAAYCGQEDASPWAQSVMGSLKETLASYGVELVSTTGAGFNPTEQISQMESSLQMGIGLLVFYVLDPEVYADVMAKADEKGVKMIGLCCMPADADKYDNYLGTVFGDAYSIGYISMDQICKAIDGKGQVALSDVINYSQDGASRRDGALAAAAQYEGIEVIEGPQIAMTVEDATSVGESMIMANPELKGYWAQWDELAIGAGSGIRNLGKSVVVSGPDISTTSAVEMLSTGMFVGSGAMSPHDLGTLAALSGIVGLGGGNTPGEKINVISPAVTVTKDNLEEAWGYVFGKELDPEVKELIK